MWESNFLDCYTALADTFRTEGGMPVKKLVAYLVTYPVPEAIVPVR